MIIYVKSGCHLKLFLVIEFSVQCCKMFCFYKLNVFCLCEIVYACHMYLLFFKNKQITKKGLRAGLVGSK